MATPSILKGQSVFITWLCAGAFCLALAQECPGAEMAPERLLVKPKAGVAEATLRAVLAGDGNLEQGSIRQIGVRFVRVPAAKAAVIADALNRHPAIEFAEPDYILPPDAVPNDTYYSVQWHLPKIGAPEAWDTTVGNSNVIIAILDSGVDSNHPDLAALITPGWNFYDDNADTADITGHGTAVAGQAAAAGNNRLGVAAVSWNCRIMPVRVSDPTGYGHLSAMANGLTYAADQGARVANLSFRASASLTVANAAAYFQSKGGVVTISAGNEGVFDPSADNPYALTVSATDANDVLASFSNRGTNIDLCAPGVNIITTTAGGGYGSGTGTSASAPIVAGVAALVISANPSLTAGQVQDILKQTTDELGPTGWDTSYGWGRVNAAKAVALALATPGGGTTDTTAPTATISAPADGSTVSGVIAIDVTATDNTGVTRVELYLDGALAGASETTPAVFSWDTTGAANGACVLQARAYDSAGNVGNSTTISIFVQNLDQIAPAVRIISPVNGATLSGKRVNVSVSATDNVGVTRVDFLVDGKLHSSSTSASPTFLWNISKLSRGQHFIQAVAHDAAGNRTRSSPVTVYK